MTLLVIVSLPLVLSLPAHAQGEHGATHDSALFKTIASLDETLFTAYNTCDLVTFGTFFVDDVEFYHDQGGLTLGRQRLVAAIKDNICVKVRRQLVSETLEVHPMEGYGALQTGSHLFCEPGSKRCQGIAKYIHLWQQKDGAWKITRVISYDHKPNQ